MSDDFEHKLLIDDGKWWDFMSADSGIKSLDGPSEDYSDQLDWSKKRALDQMRGPVGLGFFHRCIQCNKALPPDLTFCIHCGGQPRTTQSAQEYAIIIKGSEDRFAIDEAALWISSSIPKTNVKEIGAILADPPAVFTISARQEQISTLCARMNDIGIYASAHCADEVPINWVRETAESVVRTPLKIGIALGMVLASLGIMFFVSLWMIPVLLALVFVLGQRELVWYKRKYRIQIYPALNHASGFDHQLSEESIYLLEHLRDPEIKRLLSICLMEYYALSQGFRAEQSVYGDVLEQARGDLFLLLENIFNICEKFINLEKLEHPKVIQQKVLELQSRDKTIFGDQIREFQRQVSVAEKNLVMMDKTKSQFEVITLKLEALRTRFLQIRDSKYGHPEEIRLEDILEELDKELEIAEQTIQSVEIF